MSEVEEYLQEQVDHLLDALSEVIQQACYVEEEGLDSQGLSAYAEGLRVLAEYGRALITGERGDRVLAQWVEQEADDE